MPKCKKCDAEIVFVKTEHGRWMPVNAKLERFVTIEHEVAYVRSDIGPTGRAAPIRMNFASRTELFEGGE